jgi:hypothetical protein
MFNLFPPLEHRDRVQLLCWLTWGMMTNYHRSGAWPGVQYREQAIRRWLAAHEKSASWLETAQLSWIAAQLAHGNGWILETEAGRLELELVTAIGVIDYERPVMRALYLQCDERVAARGWTSGGTSA